MLLEGHGSLPPKAKRRRTLVSSSHPHPPVSSPPPPASAPGPSSAAAPQPNGAKWFRNPSVVWFRGHDLRVEDHPALLAAAQRGGPVAPLFIWDEEDNFGRDLGEVKRWWLKHSLLELTKDLKKLGVPLYIRVGRSPEELRKFLKATGADAVFWNRCYEPDLLQRDEEMRAELGLDGMTAESFKAELLVEPWELSNSGARPDFDTFHLYMRAWMAFPPPPQPFPCPSRLQPIPVDVAVGEVADLCLEYPKPLAESLSKLWKPGSLQAKIQLEKFLQEIFPVFGEGRCRRHFKGTSRLSPHVRFGELSPRRMYHATRVCVSRWDPSSELSAPLAAVLGMSLDEKSDQRRSAEAVHPEAREEIECIEGEENSESSACGSLMRNRVAPANLRENGQLKKTSKKPRSVKGTTNAKNDKGDVHSSSSPTSIPPISLSAKAFLKNLCLRDFSYHILFHHPDFDAKPLVPEFASFPWAPDDGSFDAWRLGKTGYPLVDAAMRELRNTGWVHNAMRFLLACFLTKYLLLPWQRGLKEFYGLLLDGDHSSNALGWQWTSGSNTDAFPFSCLVNPVRFGNILDPNGDYVRRWVPEVANLPKEFIHQPWKAPESVRTAAGCSLGDTYPVRIVDGGEARRRAKDAMLKMKKIFAQMRPLSTLSSLSVDSVDSLLKEWPRESDSDDEGGLFGETGLLPSLWSLLYSNDSSAPVWSTDPVAGHDVGKANGSSVPDGTSFVNDNHNSIEHALLMAHSATGPDDLLCEEMPVAGNVGYGTVKHGTGGTRKSFGRTKRRMALRTPDEDTVATRIGSRHYQHNGRPTVKDSNSEIVGAQQQPPEGSTRIPAYGVVPQYPPIARHHAPNAHHHPLMMQSQLNQVHQPGAQHQMANNGMVYDGLYGTGIAPAPGAGVPLTNFPVLVGHGPGGVEPGMPNGMNAAEFNNPAFYAHQMNVSQMYGLPSVVPIMPSQRMGRADGDQRPNGSPGPAAAAASPRHFGLPSNFPVPFGLYGGNPSFDPNGFPNVMSVNEANQYAALHAVSHQNPPRTLSRAGQPCIAPHHMYMPPPGSADVMHGTSGLFPGTGHLNPHNSIPGNGHCGNNREIAPNGPAVNTSAREEVAAESGVLHGNSTRKALSVSPTSSGRRDPASGASRSGSSSAPRKPKATIQKSGSSNRGRSRGTSKVISPGGSSRRGAAKGSTSKSTSPTRGRGGSRGRRGSGARASKNRADSRGTTSGSGSGGIGANALGRIGKPDGQSVVNALKARQRMLDSVGQEEGHEYYHFARFLTGTYELTGNTDRHTSKDYIRLCTLKDNYHKQCQSDNEKLKIYRIKAFFSKILDLEVTGEWDRHNHGGVRGPYVYGIRLKPANLKDSDIAPKGDASSVVKKSRKAVSQR